MDMSLSWGRQGSPSASDTGHLLENVTLKDREGDGKLTLGIVLGRWVLMMADECN
jgi:hypothetical protein